jgi:HTH-type transcriptional regulator / antitoxin HigA
MQAHQFEQVIRDYRRLRTLVPLGTLRSKKDYSRAVELLDVILDEIGEDEKHPMAEIADVLSVFIEKYEAEHVPIPDAKPAAVLMFLMREHGLRQSDLPEIGSQGVVSEVLTGKRDLNTRQIKKLAKRFNISPAVFV